MSVALHHCAECGGDLLVGSAGLICARCLLGVAVAESTTSTDTSSRELTVLLSRPTSPLGVKCHQFGDYELLEEIARGGMGVVFRARQVSLNRVVALKMIAAGHLASAESVKRFEGEARAAARLDHPNIVPIYDVGEHDGLHYFTMKLVEGGNLAEAMRARHFAPSDAAHLVAAIARALHHAHQRDVLHRDLKPENILLDREGMPHITDFGLAKVIDLASGSQTGAILGTPAYVAPEQALGESKPSRAADIYSLGVILYELLAQRLPFDAHTPLQLVQKAREATVPRLRASGVDADLEAICFKCLDADPAQRYASAEAFADDLARWLNGEAVGARRPSPIANVRRWMRRRPALAALIMVCALAATAVPVLLKEVRAARAEKNAFVSSVRSEKVRELEALRKQWANLEVPFVSVSSELRSEIWKARASTAFPDGDTERYRVGIYAHEKPVETAGQFAPMLAWLESELSSARSNRVRLDLHIYKHNRAARQALVHGVVDVVRLGAGPFLRAHDELAQQGKSVEVIAKSSPGEYYGVVFARGDSGITNIAGLKGRTLALGSLESTISGFHVPALLAESGLSARDLRIVFHRSHNEAVSGVQNGNFDAGAAKANVFEKQRRRGSGLVEIGRVSCIAMPWVARNGLRPDVAALFRRTLVALKDPNILELLPDQPQEGFEAASAADYAAMREHEANAERFLDGAEELATNTTRVVVKKSPATR